ncbi:uncharacterized protein BXZ73DRAFT_82003 [Epithele typhae]|uniref:uncharacterized protein n=1 Tax=Epithele typhae TaxID=378194 RepID=UPI0020084D26|nr:uncharacterized protein BXZ73DRAFT_83099 [Epithele typhae]XP_047872163.1 uncharacterized protein BXZ73DRAFT_82003 [Epithele typhae]KAH9910877.1 hypothetical protein BXZ73DRAFT_83099 [Epithele typhae]KAH9913156.1 hypothetical protein BXZ73DRAFT_82003 [Epithele typhae]
MARPGPRMDACAFPALAAPPLADGTPHVAAFECTVPHRWVTFGDADLEVLVRAWLACAWFALTRLLVRHSSFLDYSESSSPATQPGPGLCTCLCIESEPDAMARTCGTRGGVNVSATGGGRCGEQFSGHNF